MVRRMGGSGRRSPGTPGRSAPPGVADFAYRILVTGLLSLGVGACSDPAGTAVPPRGNGALAQANDCNLDPDYLRDGGVGKDGIPALTDPSFVAAEPGPENAYLEDENRVVGIVVNGQALAIPHNALWYHEIVNLNLPGGRLAVTYCPLTGSSMVFDRDAVDGDEFGVSGLLWKNNLIMYNRRSGESLWPQMLGQARCGPLEGRSLPRYPAQDMTWDGWKHLHPTTRVLSSTESLGRDWETNPYGNYEALSNDRFLFQDAMPPLDRRRPIKERVLGVPAGSQGGMAFPFGLLEEAEKSGERAAVNATVSRELGEHRIVVFWNGEARGAVAFHAHLDGQPLTFRVESGLIRDVETGTAWTLEGEGWGGELNDARLDPVADAFVAFWGAWAAFRPDTQLWEGGEDLTAGAAFSGR